jgi:hypothetical protein
VFEPAGIVDRTTGNRKRVLLVAQLDGYANGVKAEGVAEFLRARGHDVEMLNTYYLSRASGRSGSPATKLPRPGVRRLVMYAAEAVSRLTRRSKLARRHLSYYTALADFRMRRSLLGSKLALDDQPPAREVPGPGEGALRERRRAVVRVGVLRPLRRPALRHQRPQLKAAELGLHAVR